MTLYKLLTKLKKDGSLDLLYKEGIISHKPIYYLDIYNELKSKKLSQQDLAIRLGVCKKTIQRANKMFKP